MATGQSSYSSTGGTTYFDLTKDTGDRAEINNALFFQFKPDSSSGTGLIQAIVRVQDPGSDATPGFENGYNTSFRPLSYEENTSPQFTTSLLLSEVPIVTINGQQYYEFRLDINQLNSSSLLSLDALKIYTSAVGDGLAQGTIGGAWFTANADPVYDMDGAGNTSVLLDASLSSGSGSSDLFFYVPVSNFGAVDPDDTYVTLYSEFGAANVLDGTDGITPLDDPANADLNDSGDDTGDVATAIFGTYTANDGFEEWSVSKQTGGVISGYKWADTDGDGVWDAGELGLGGFSIDYSISYDAGHGKNVQHVVVDGTAVTSDGTQDVNGDGVIDPAGFYSILVPASSDKNETYTITLTEQPKAGYVNTYDGDATANSTTTFTFSSSDLTTTGTPASPNISGHFGVTENMNFGNRLLIPHITLSKVAEFDDGSDCADEVGELINYSISVTNDGELALTNVVVTDTLADVGSIEAVDLDNDTFNDGDTNADGVLDIGETWLYTAYHTVTQDEIDAGGNYDSDDPADGVLDSLRNVATVNADSTNGSVTDDDDAVVEVCQNPHITVDKTATPTGDCADVAGELINYSISVTNDGNVTLDTVVVTDTLADSGSVEAVDLDNDTFNDGDTDADGKLDVGETWLYTAYHTVTQDEIDAGGNYDSDDPADGILDSLRNVATATAEVVNSDTQVTDDDDAIVEVCQNPGVDVEKYVMTDVNGAFADADNPDGPEASTSSTVEFKVVVTNTGNVTLTDIDLADSVVHTVGGVPGAPVAIDYTALGAYIDLNDNHILDSGEEWSNFDTDNDGTLDDDGSGNPFELAVGDSFTIYYSLDSQLGQHENTVTVTTAEAATDSDDANYYVLANEDCVGVRTPGFWSNWGGFWDGVSNNQPKQQGQPGFAAGELIYAVDSDGNGVVNALDTNGDGFINGAPKDGVNDNKPIDTSVGLLIGDYNMNGITDVGEDTIFISLADAKTLINASQKQQGDGVYMLGRDLVATWLNYLANNDETIGECIGDVDSSDGTSDPREFIDAAIDWMQQFASDKNDAGELGSAETFAAFKFDGAVKTNHANWQTAFTGAAGTADDIPVSAAAMHSALDAYNNTGVIGGEEFCCSADNHVALSALAQISLV